MIRIVTDTTSGLPAEYATAHHIPVVPQVIIFGEEQFLEMEEMSMADFMLRLSTSRELPKTAAPAPSAMEEAYQPFVQAGDTILSLHPSTDLSGTIRSATVAAQTFPAADIRILDTRTIGAPLARLVMRAQEWIDAGVDAGTIITRLMAIIPRMRIFFLVDTLEFLQRGGRIGGASAFVGGLLQMKPILALVDGKVEAVERQRTHKRALERTKELVLAESGHGDDAMLTVMHAGNPAVAASLAEELRSALNAPDVFIMDLVPAIVTHAGPGALAVGFVARKTS